jgi:hypothetical protein
VLAAALLLAALVQPGGTPALAAAPAQALVAAAPAAPQGCGPIIVTNTSDSGGGSLRAAVECALLAGVLRILIGDNSGPRGSTPTGRLAWVGKTWGW